MTSKNEWEEFFDGHAPVYMNNEFTRNTIAEVDSLIEEPTPLRGRSTLGEMKILIMAHKKE